MDRKDGQPAFDLDGVNIFDAYNSYSPDTCYQGLLPPAKLLPDVFHSVVVHGMGNPFCKATGGLALLYGIP